MKLRRTTSLAALAALALTGVLVAPGSPATGSTAQAPSARASLGSLSVSPTRYVGGQMLTWTGRLPVKGVRTITMQRFLNRPGDSWIDVHDFKGKTKADGSFSFTYPAPDMMHIGFRVKSGRYATTKYDFSTKMQDVELSVPGAVVAGQPFTINVDTTPTGAPVFEGRPLTLQRRSSPTDWTTIRTSTVDASGHGKFSGLTEPAAGDAVYRVIEEDWNQIGWYPSYPTYIHVASASGRAATTTVSRSTTDRIVAAGTTASKTAARRTAALRWKWGYPNFDFDWTSGESLTSKPWRGSRQQGQWTEYLGGTGRVAKSSGALGLWSGPKDNRYGGGNRGTTATTLHGNAQSYGRWELKLTTNTRTVGPKYTVLAELVPEDADYSCADHNITIAKLRQGDSKAEIGAVKGTSQWTRSVDLGNIENSAPSVGVELMKRHVTWFVNSAPVGTLKTRAITGGVPMTLRISLIGSDNEEMQNTKLLSDWQRGFPINRSPGVLGGASLKKSAYTPTC